MKTINVRWMVVAVVVLTALLLITKAQPSTELRGVPTVLVNKVEYNIYIPLLSIPETIQQIGGISSHAPYSNIETMAMAGAKLVRTDLWWNSVEPVQGARDWASGSNAYLENGIVTASQNGMSVILIPQAAPQWARQYPGSLCGPIRQDAIIAYAKFVADAVARYSVPPYNVKYWEIWNEPDIAVIQETDYQTWGCWGDPKDSYFGGGYYADVLRAVYPAIKSVDPESQVIFGGLLLGCDPNTQVNCDKSATYIEGALRNGAADYFDAVSYHAYDYYYGSSGKYGNTDWKSSWDSTGPVGITKASYLASMLNSYGASNKYLLLTEAAVLCWMCSGETKDYSVTKSSYIAQLYSSTLANNIYSTVWYEWMSSDINGDASTVYAFAQKKLKDVISAREIDVENGVRVYEFYTANKIMRVAWSVDGSPHSIKFVDGAPGAAWDMYGNPVGTDAPIYYPTYLEWFVFNQQEK